MIKIISSKGPEIERKRVNQVFSNEELLNGIGLEELDKIVRQRLRIPEEAIRVRMGRNFVGEVYEWVWWETSFNA